MRDDLLIKLKLYCKVDFKDDDLLLSMLYKAAVRYLLSAGIEEDVEDEEYLLLAFAITNEWYDQGSQGDVTVGIRQLINQFKLSSVEVGGM